MKIYLAAPIHKEHDQKSNESLLCLLREQNFDVWSPQEAGIASEEAKRKNLPLDEVRARYAMLDLAAMRDCNICLAYIDRDEGLSEGMLWEMGWFNGKHRPVIFLNPRKLKVTLMVQFTVDFTCETFADVIELLHNLEKQGNV